MIPLEQWCSGSQSTKRISEGDQRRLQVVSGWHVDASPTLPAALGEEDVPHPQHPENWYFAAS